MGRGMRTSAAVTGGGGAPCAPASSASRTRPATVKSRSSQVAQMPPPYVSTPTCSSPALFLVDTGFTRRHGESVCAAATLNPPPGTYAPPTVNAMTAVPDRVVKYLPPGTTAHGDRSCSRTNPPSVSRRATSSTAWYGEGEAFRKRTRSCDAEVVAAVVLAILAVACASE